MTLPSSLEELQGWCRGAPPLGPDFGRAFVRGYVTDDAYARSSQERKLRELVREGVVISARPGHPYRLFEQKHGGRAYEMWAYVKYANCPITRSLMELLLLYDRERALVALYWCLRNATESRLSAATMIGFTQCFPGGVPDSTQGYQAEMAGRGLVFDRHSCYEALGELTKAPDWQVDRSCFLTDEEWHQANPL